MKITAFVLALAAYAGSADFASAAECTRTKVARGPTGMTKTVCLDGKYSTCMRDSQSVGWSHAQAKAYCDERKRLGMIK